MILLTGNFTINVRVCTQTRYQFDGSEIVMEVYFYFYPFVLLYIIIPCRENDFITNDRHRQVANRLAMGGV